VVDLAGRGDRDADGCQGSPEDDGRRELADSAGAEEAETAALGQISFKRR
jgi:hypothetical protein